MMRGLLRVLWYWAPLALYAGLIFGLSSMEHLALPLPAIPHLDKLLHLAEYAGLGALFCRGLAMGGEGLSPWIAVISAILLGTLYGTSDELHQALVPGRSPELLDLLTDVIGAALGSLLYRALALRGIGPENRVPPVRPEPGA